MPEDGGENHEEPDRQGEGEEAGLTVAQERPQVEAELVAGHGERRTGHRGFLSVGSVRER